MRIKLKNNQGKDLIPDPEIKFTDVKDKESMQKYHEYRERNKHLFEEPKEIRILKKDEVRIIRQYGRRRFLNSIAWAIFYISLASILTFFAVFKAIINIIGEDGIYYALPVICLLVFFTYLLAVDENPRTMKYIKMNEDDKIYKYKGEYKSIKPFVITRRMIGKYEVRFLSKDEALKADGVYQGKKVGVELVGREAPYLVMKILNNN